MLIKIFIIFLMIAIIATLASSMIFLIRSNGKDKKLIKALTLRIGLSLLLFILLFVAFSAGLITPHGIRP